MKRPPTASPSEPATRLATASTANAAHDLAVLRTTTRVFKQPRNNSKKHFHIVTAAAGIPTGLRPALVASDVREIDELRRLQPLVEAIISQAHPTILVAGLNTNRPCRTVEARVLRNHLTDLGAVFVERPADATTPAKVAAFLDREYAPDEETIAAALQPQAPITPLIGHDLSPYLEPPPIEGDQYFLSHHPASKKG